MQIHHGDGEVAHCHPTGDIIWISLPSLGSLLVSFWRRGDRGIVIAVGR
jgi:hypothetical protein